MQPSNWIPYSRVTADDLLTFVESAFWASLTTEEGRYHALRVSLGPPVEYSSDYTFCVPKPCTPSELSDLAAVLDKNYKSIGVWYSSSGSLEVWGIAELAVWVRIAANSPGQMLFSVLGGLKSFDVAITGSWWGFVEKAKGPITWAYFAGMTPRTILDLYQERITKGLLRSHAYTSIAQSMLQHRHGGILAIVPEDNDHWRSSVGSIRYEGNIFEEIREAVDNWNTVIQEHVESKKLFSYEDESERIRQRSNQALEFVAQLTAVDGATLLGRDLSIYGFGAKLKPADSNKKPSTVLVSRPFEEEGFEEVATSDLGGTRHQSAAQFVYDQRDCVAIVCSQDGRLSALSRDPDNESVQVVTNLEYAL